MRRTVTLVVLLACFAASLQSQRIELPMKKKDLERAVQQNPNDAAAHYNVALAYWNEERWDDVRTSLATSLAIEPRLAEAHLALAYLPYAIDDDLWEERFEDDLSDSLRFVLEEANRHERHAYLIDPMVDRAIIGAVTPGMPAIWSSSDFLRELYTRYLQAFDDFLQRDYDNAYHRYNRMLTEWSRSLGVDQDDPPRQWLWYRALSAAKTERYDEARNDLNRLLDLSLEAEQSDDLVRIPLRTNEYRYMLAALEHLAGNHQTALDLYREVAENDIGLYMAHVRMAEIYEAHRLFPEAIEERRMAVNANPDDATLVMDLAIAFGKAGDFSTAEDYLLQAREANGKQPMIPFWLGLAQMEQQQWRKARNSFEDFLGMASTRYQRQIELAQKNLAKLPQ